MKSRRGFLATLTAIAAAGCQGQGQPPTTTATTATTTATTTTTTAPTTETTTEKPTRQTTETTTTEAGPSEAELTAEALSNVKRALYRGFSDYTAFAGTQNTTFLDVTAATPVFAPGEILEHVSTARSELATARQHAQPDQQQTISQLEAAIAFLANAVRVQQYLIQGHPEVSAAMTALHDGEWSRYDTAVDALKNTETRAEGYLDQLESKTDPGDLDVLRDLPGNYYSGKLQQFEDELAVYHALTANTAPIRDGTKDLLEGLTAYQNSDYGTARPRFDTAEATLDDVSLTELPSPGSLSAWSRELQCLPDAYETAARELESAAQAYLTQGSDASVSEYETAARNALKDCPAATNTIVVSDWITQPTTTQ